MNKEVKLDNKECVKENLSKREIPQMREQQRGEDDIKTKAREK